VLKFSPDQGEMVLESLHPGATLDQVQENTGWPLRAASWLTQTEPPSDEELRVLREEFGQRAAAS